MFTLIKIRTQYLFSHPCGIFWVYLFVPLIIFLTTSGLFTGETKLVTVTYSPAEGKDLNLRKTVFEGRSLSGSNLALISDDEEDKNILKSLNSDIEWTKDENNVGNKHVIKLIKKIYNLIN